MVSENNDNGTDQFQGGEGEGEEKRLTKTDGWKQLLSRAVTSRFDYNSDVMNKIVQRNYFDLDANWMDGILIEIIVLINELTQTHFETKQQ